MNDQPCDLDRLIDRMRSGELTPAEVRDLERRLAADPALRRRYRRRVRLEANLLATFRSPQPELTPLAWLETRQPPRRRWWPLAAGLGIAASLAAAAFLALLGREAGDRAARPSAVARVESADGAAWAGTQPLAAGSSLTAGELDLRSGVAAVRFHSGALLNLQAPARVTLVDPMRCRLLAGTAVVEVPDSARGFVVETPAGFAVDHGTQFAVTVDGPAARAEFEVLSGEISVHHQASGGELRMQEGEASSMTTAAGIIPLPVPPSQRLAKPAPDLLRLPAARVTSIVRSNEWAKRLDPSLLMVKRSSPDDVKEPSDRRALISFDLDDLDGQDPARIRSARLRLNLVPSGLGYAFYLPETCTFEVYGIADDRSLESWPAEDLRWEDAPGSLDAGTAIDPAAVRLLGALDIARGQIDGTILFESDTLTDFIRADTTGQAGFLIVQQTRAFAMWSLVHAFAARNHPTASGPSLELVLP